MKYRNFANTGLPVSEFGLGTWGLDESMWGRYDRAQATRAMHRALDLGVNLIDTAPAYGDGHAEALIGGVLEDMGLRHDVILATKITPLVPVAYPSSHLHADTVYPYQSVIDSAEQSLRRLRTGHIDLLQLHAWDKRWLHEGDWLEALYRLKADGKVRCVGVSILDHDSEGAAELAASGVVDSIQVMYNLFDQSAQRELFPVCRAHGVSALVRSPLYEGILSGKIGPGHRFAEGDWRADYFAGDFLKSVVEHRQKIQDAFGLTAEEMASFALRFALSSPEVACVLVGMRTMEHAELNCRVSGTGLLDTEVMEALGDFDFFGVGITQQGVEAD
jgi:aryl-alcohol dehydrogenase-like predicted oxidoreductase